MECKVEKTVTYKLELNEEEMNTIVASLGKMNSKELSDFSDRNNKKVLSFDIHNVLYRELADSIGLFDR